MTPGELHIDRLLQVRSEILADPASFEMGDFVSAVYDESHEYCGTALCIGGRAAVAAGYIVLRTTPRPGTACAYYDIAPDAPADPFAAALSLSKPQAARLFYVDNWPKGFRGTFERAKTPAARASAAAQRIDHFIRMEGRE